LKMSYKIFKYYSNEHKRSLTTVTKWYIIFIKRRIKWK
jgi:hypothetical protein